MNVTEKTSYRNCFFSYTIILWITILFLESVDQIGKLPTMSVHECALSLRAVGFVVYNLSSWCISCTPQRNYCVMFLSLAFTDLNQVNTNKINQKFVKIKLKINKYRIYSNWGARCQDQILKVLFSKNQKDQYIIGTADSDNDSTHKQDLDYEPMSPEH